MPTNQQHDEWQDCPTGELSQMVGRLNTSQDRARRNRLFGKAAACMLLVACGVIAVGSVLDSGDPLYGGITCLECKEHFVAYHGNQTASKTMENTLALSMATHLKHCERCHNLFEQSYPGVLSAELSNQATMPLFAVARYAPLY